MLALAVLPGCDKGLGGERVRLPKFPSSPELTPVQTLAEVVAAAKSPWKGTARSRVVSFWRVRLPYWVRS